jgi:hypothetical protein
MGLDKGSWDEEIAICTEIGEMIASESPYLEFVRAGLMWWPLFGICFRFPFITTAYFGDQNWCSPYEGVFTFMHIERKTKTETAIWITLEIERILDDWKSKAPTV